MSGLLIGIAVVAVFWGVTSALVMTEAVRRRGHPVHWLFLKWQILKHVARYREVTRRETGQTGPWFFSFVIAMSAALACAVAGVLLRLSR